MNSRLLPPEWTAADFTDLITKASHSKVPKAPKSSYRETGAYPVVDQGQSNIAGWVDDEDLLFPGDLPVIVFGDHTRIVKYVDFPFVVGADGTQLLRPNAARLDTRYFYYALANLSLKNLGYSRHFKLLKEQKLMYPKSLGEQRKIASILSSVDDAIEKTQAVIDQVQVVKKGLMQELLTRGLPGRHSKFKKTEAGEFPEEWEVVPLAQVGTVLTGTTPSPKVAEYWNGPYPFVTPGDLSDNHRIVDRTERSLTEQGLSACRRVPPRAILVTCIGATIGKLGMLERECATNQQINAVVCSANFTPDYVYYALARMKPILAAMAGHTAVPIVSKGHFQTLAVSRPSLGEQRRIADTLTALDESIEANDARLGCLQRLKHALISILLTGEVRVQPEPEGT